MAALTWNPSFRISREVPAGVCGVYLIRNLKTGRVYVGSSVDVRRRWLEHARGLSQGRHSCDSLAQDWSNQGQTLFQFELATRCSPEQLSVCEQLAIHAHRNRLYNTQRTVARAGARQAKRSALAAFADHVEKETAVRAPSQQEVRAWERGLVRFAGTGLAAALLVAASITLGFPRLVAWLSVLACLSLGGTLAWLLFDTPYRKVSKARRALIQTRVAALYRALYPNAANAN